MKSNFANVEIRFEEQVAKPPTGLISEKIVGESKSLERKKHFLFVGATDCTTNTNVNTD